MAVSLKILFAASECVPFAKTGGLGDVAGALPRFIKRLGHDIIIVIPLYSSINKEKYDLIPVRENMNVVMGNESFICNAFKTVLPDNLPVYFIDYEPFFGRAGLYHDDYFNDYSDNPKRFIFLSKAALQLCHEISFAPDIVHANDWHTAILPAFLKRTYRNDPFFSDTASVLTIHNLAYQGFYDRFFYKYTGLGEEDYTADKFECLNAINLLKGGIYFADMLNTVSEGYAAETKTAEGGYGLDAFLNMRGSDYVGIINGVDYSEWDPAIDTLIPANYSAEDISGKYECKRVLQDHLGLEQSQGVPVIGIVSRLVQQKGFHILAQCIEGMLDNMDVLFAILGSGDRDLERFYGDLPGRHPGRLGTYIGYNNELAHLIEAGSDLFLMPSLYEPCGLNQIYSLKYGTLPVVRATGGLNDTVENYNQDTGGGTGFKFNIPSSEAIYNTVKWALETYFMRRQHFGCLIRNAMGQNFPWEESAKKYIELYKKAIRNKNTPDSLRKT